MRPWPWARPAIGANLYSYYNDADKYTGQLRKLEKTVADAPNSAPGQFLLGYHYLMTGAKAEAKEHFAQAAKLTPNDKLAQHILEQFESSSPVTPPKLPATPARRTKGQAAVNSPAAFSICISSPVAEILTNGGNQANNIRCSVVRTPVKTPFRCTRAPACGSRLSKVFQASEEPPTQPGLACDGTAEIGNADVLAAERAGLCWRFSRRTVYLMNWSLHARG